MSSEVLKVETRETRGKRGARRLRHAGKIPAVLYGHNEASVSLSLSYDQLRTALRHGAHLVQLSGAVSDSALLKDIQWDPYGINVLHVDLVRVDAHETVTVTLAVELRGDCAGTHHGGVIDHQMHELQIECPASAIPEKLVVTINQLEVGQQITVSDVELPAKVTAVAEPDAVIVACVEPAAEQEEVEAAVLAGESEPEVIGRKAEDGDEAGAAN